MTETVGNVADAGAAVLSDIWAIDIMCNFEFDDPDVVRPGWYEDFIGQKIGGAAEPLTPELLIEKMDRAHVQHAFLLAEKAGSTSHRIHKRIPLKSVDRVVGQYPERFSGLMGIDPTEGMAGLRALESAVRDHGFVGAHLYPHWFEMAPDHALYYPYYAKCCELDIPIQMQVGHCLRYSAKRPLRSVGRPITLDTVACDFPELKLIGIHMGWPWTEEMISVAYKHSNVYIGSDAYAPAYWPREFVRYLDSWGRGKVLFGTDYPVIDPERAMKEIQDLGIRELSQKRFLRNNAIGLYRLPFEPSKE